MALSAASLQARIVNALVAAGANPEGEHSWVNRLAEAIASAVVAEIQANAEVTVSGGSSAGTYPVK